ncbi:integrase [Streptomyces sp. NPDC096033]|uniref:integrase n=1 Tax=Streptomyces sp. NPDC096033 TaxID=3366071 RepID=UPI0038283908
MPCTPDWWDALTAHLATHRNVFYGADTLAHTARLVIDTGHTDPHDLLTEARRTRPWLGRLLADFFHTHDLLEAPADILSSRAAVRRERRIAAVPAPLRPAVRAFADVLVARRENAENLGLRPNQLKTIEIRLDTVRDLALHLHAKGHTTWAGVNAGDLEAFLARNPARRASWLAGLRQFFSHAHQTGLVLHDPAAAMQAPQPRGFSGSTLTLDEQRVLYRRWRTGEGVLPHEAFIGLAALLHAATTTELRHLTLTDITTASRTVRFPGRSVDLALDDATWRALEACLTHRQALHTDNPHVLVTRLTRVTTNPASAAHIRDSLAPVGLLPRILRSTRLLTLADELDIKQLTVALGMSYGGTAHYQ